MEATCTNLSLSLSLSLTRAHTHTHTHTHIMEYYSAIKKNGVLPFFIAWMKLVSIMLSEINQIENNEYHMISPVCGN